MASAGGLENFKAGVAVDDVDEPACVDEDVVVLRAVLPGRGIWDIPADLFGRGRVADVDHPQASREPCAEEPVAGHTLLELVRAEAPLVAERQISLAHMKHRERADIGAVFDVEEPQAAMELPLAVIVLFVDRDRDLPSLPAHRYRGERDW